MVKEAENAGRKFGVGRSQTRLHFDDGEKAFLKVFKETSSSGSAIPNVSWSHEQQSPSPRPLCWNVVM